MTRQVLGGIYVLRFSHKTVKIGMASNLKQRIRQYKGYSPQGKGYPTLLIIKSKKYKELEKKVHQFIGWKYQRIGRLEIFKCTDHKKLVKQIINLVKDNRSLVYSVSTNSSRKD